MGAASAYEIGRYSTPMGIAADIISVVLLSLAIVGSSLVIAAIHHLDNKNKLRARVLISLFVSHVWSGVVFLVSICASLAGHPPRDGTAACEASAVFVESATWVQYLLAIAVAAVSYTLLLHPLSRLTLLLERYWFLILLLVCSVSVGIAAVQASLYAAVYVGGFCWNGSTGDTFNELLNFIPRAIVFLVIVTVYGRIHWFLRSRGKVTMDGGIPQALTTSPTGVVAEDGQPWEKLYLSGLSNIVRPGDPQSSRQDSVYRCQLSRALAPDPYKIDGVVGMKCEMANADHAKAICGETGELASASTPATKVPASYVPSDSSSVSGTPGGDARPLSSQRGPYATGAAHTPYQGSLPIARCRAKQEHFEALQVLLTRKAAMLFLLFPLTYFVLTLISAVRLIDDYVESSHPNQVVRAISRWALFLQGSLDALIYGVFAFKVKKAVGKEIKLRWAARGLGA